MSSHTEERNGPPVDTALMLLALAIIGGAIYGFYALADQYNVLVRVLGVIGAVVLALAVIYQTQSGKAAWAYVQGARVELRKVVWPTRQEALQTTLLIAAIVFVLALGIWALDALLLMGVKALLGRG